MVGYVAGFPSEILESCFLKLASVVFFFSRTGITVIDSDRPSMCNLLHFVMSVTDVTWGCVSSSSLGHLNWGKSGALDTPGYSSTCSTELPVLGGTCFIVLILKQCYLVNILIFKFILMLFSCLNSQILCLVLIFKC